MDCEYANTHCDTRNCLNCEYYKDDMMRRAKVDSNQKDIVEDLRKLPGVSAEPGYNDIIVGFRGHTFWYELKNPDKISKKTGKLIKSAKRNSQKKLDETWTGHRKYVTSFEEILTDITERTMKGNKLHLG